MSIFNFRVGVGVGEPVAIGDYVISLFVLQGVL